MFTTKRLLVGGALLVLIGIEFGNFGLTLTHSLCWGHLGCDYYIRTFNWLGYTGVLVGIVGAIVFFEALLYTRAAIVSKIVLAIGVILIALVCLTLLSLSRAFIYGSLQ